MAQTDEERLIQLFSPLEVPEEISVKRKEILIMLSEQVYPERDELTISNEEKMKRMLSVFFYKNALGKDLFKYLQQTLKSKIHLKQNEEVTRRSQSALP